jgi:hypothetical protein
LFFAIDGYEQDVGSRVGDEDVFAWWWWCFDAVEIGHFGFWWRRYCSDIKIDKLVRERV